MKNQNPSRLNRKEQTELIQKQRDKLGLSRIVSYKHDVEPHLEDIKKMKLEGKTNIDIMLKYNIAYNTFYGWLGNTSKQKTAFKKIIKEAEDTLKEQNIAKLESNLLKRAEGMTIKETITDTYVDANGKEKTSVREIVKELPPDVKAIETYLKHNSIKYKSDKLVDNNIIIGDNKTNIDNDKQIIINIKTTEDGKNGVER